MRRPDKLGKIWNDLVTLPSSESGEMTIVKSESFVCLDHQSLDGGKGTTEWWWTLCKRLRSVHITVDLTSAVELFIDDLLVFCSMLVFTAQ